MNVMLAETGLHDAVRDAQATFRSAMMAMAEPGTLRRIAAAVVAPAPLMPATAALVLALADFETPVWLDPDAAAAADYLRFHTGARIVAERSRAAFAVAADLASVSSFGGFAFGSLEYPDRSTTLIVQVDSLAADGGWRLSGPGIDGVRRLAIAGAGADLATEFQTNNALFPRGIDVYFVAGDTIAALPRSTRVEA